MTLASAARELLSEIEAGEGGDVRRVTLEVTAEGRTELVTVTLQSNGSLLVGATDGRTSGAHVRAALELLAGVAEERSAERDGDQAMPTSATSPYAPLASALDDLLIAIARHGTTNAYGTASVDEAIDGVLGATHAPIPTGVSRFVGRLRNELANGRSYVVARMLDGASRLVAHLREEPSSDDERRRIAAWLGRPGDLDAPGETLNERTFVEVAREWIAGTKRSGIQRRYLVCTRSGEVFREERARASAGSVGPCPRQIVAGFAEVEDGPAPRRIRLLQYALAASVSGGQWERIRSLAVREAADLGPRYRADLKAFPALAEPFVVVRTQHVDPAAGLLVTPASDTLALDLGPGGAERLATVSRDHAVRWIAGRLEDDEDGSLLLRGFSAGIDVDGTTAFERIQ